MLKFLALQSKGSLILKPVSWGFVFCGIKSEQEPLAGSTQRFPILKLCCFVSQQRNWSQRQTKQKRALKTNRWIRLKKTQEMQGYVLCA